MAEAITGLDVDVLHWIQQNLRGEIGDAIVTFITHLGDLGILWIALCLLLIAIPRTRRAGIATAISLAICFVIVNLILKPMVMRPRPYDLYSILIPLVREGDFSFPSGHTSAAFACSLVMIRTLPAKIGVPVLALSILIALSRLYVGVHYPSDVIAAFLLALAVSQIVVMVYRRILMERERDMADAAGDF